MLNTLVGVRCGGRLLRCVVNGVFFPCIFSCLSQIFYDCTDVHTIWCMYDTASEFGVCSIILLVSLTAIVSLYNYTGRTGTHDESIFLGKICCY